MSVYYVDGVNGDNENDGLSFGNAFKTIQYALDNVSGAHQIRICATGDYTLTAPIDDDTNVGASTSWMDVVGANASGEIDGTLAVIDADSTAANCFNHDQAGYYYKRFRNLEIKNATSHGVLCNGNTFALSYENCWIHNNGGMGLSGYYYTYCFLYKCLIENNSSYGAQIGGLTHVLFSEFKNNNNYQLYSVSQGCCVFGSVFHGSGGTGVYHNLYGSSIINCVLDGFATGGYFNRESVFALGNRVTNCTNGLRFNTVRGVFEDWNHFSNCTTDILNMSGGFSGGNSLLDQTADGYNDRDNDDFNPASDALLRRAMESLGYGSSLTNKFYITAGLSGDDVASEAVPDDPTGIAALKISSSSIRVSWDFSASANSFDVYRATSQGGSYSKVGSAVTALYYDDSGLSASTTYYYKVKATNDGGDSDFSSIVSETTKSSDLTTFGDLLESVQTKIQGLSDFTSTNVIVGQFADLRSRGASGFPACEILIDNDTGSEYASTRDLVTDHRLQIHIHTWAETEDRIDGGDMQELDRIAEAVRTALYGILDDAQGGNPPCDGFQIVQPDYSKDLAYQEYTKKINTAVLTIGFWVDKADTSS